MKIRIFFIFIMLFILVFSLVSCKRLKTTEKYLNAMANNLSTEMYESKAKLNINFDFSKSSEELKKNVKGFSKITINSDEAISKDKGIVKNFLSSDKMILDTDIYIEGENVFMKSLLTDEKYIKLNDEEAKADEKLFKNGENIFDKTILIWKTTIQNELITDEGSTILTTPDGDIKVTQLSIELNDKKGKKIFDELIKLLAKSPEIKDLILNNLEYGEFYEDINIDIKKEREALTKFFDDLEKNKEKYKEKFEILDFKSIAKIDKDNYIREYTFEGTLNIYNDGVIKLNFNYEKEYWDLSPDSLDDFPEIKKTDVITVEEFNKKNNMKDYFSSGN